MHIDTLTHINTLTFIHTYIHTHMFITYSHIHTHIYTLSLTSIRTPMLKLENMQKNKILRICVGLEVCGNYGKANNLPSNKNYRL